MHPTVEETFGISSDFSDIPFCLQWLFSICILSSAVNMLWLSSRSTRNTLSKTEGFRFAASIYTAFLQERRTLERSPRVLRMLSLYLSRFVNFSYSTPNTPMTSSRINNCLHFGCPYCLISVISSTGTISNSQSFCSRRARWRAVVVLPDPGPPIIVVIGCDWTLSRMSGKLWISWNGLSPFSQYSRSVFCCSTKQNWDGLHCLEWHYVYSIQNSPSVY